MSSPGSGGSWFSPGGGGYESHSSSGYSGRYEPRDSPPGQQPRRTSPVLWVALVVGIIAVAGTGWLFLKRSDDPTAADSQQVQTVQSAVAAANAAPACAEVFVPGNVIDASKLKDGCKDASGGIQFVGASNCADGSVLYQVDASTGAPAGWGVGGKKYRAAKGEVAADPAYGKAVRDCNG
ncbi:hypothetical protein ACTOB_001407 [Actinoplanes oblitus]|uniref:Uncharacterized protein n=1 Tax=Actinoplanes oblitus TaxID=3040509 RepID=A0ABY8WJN7_9ACTN|nr:hypothetical protein [Actinoplanes oblitus]WIM97853.1 hypothetical protein ACTOB_001407 [Actinoplanes oblitus]